MWLALTATTFSNLIFMTHWFHTTIKTPFNNNYTLTHFSFPTSSFYLQLHHLLPYRLLQSLLHLLLLHSCLFDENFYFIDRSCQFSQCIRFPQFVQLLPPIWPTFPKLTIDLHIRLISVTRFQIIQLTSLLHTRLFLLKLSQKLPLSCCKHVSQKFYPVSLAHQSATVVRNATFLVKINNVLF